MVVSFGAIADDVEHLESELDLLLDGAFLPSGDVAARSAYRESYPCVQDCQVQMAHLALATVLAYMQGPTRPIADERQPTLPFDIA